MTGLVLASSGHKTPNRPEDAIRAVRPEDAIRTVHLEDAIWAVHPHVQPEDAIRAFRLTHYPPWDVHPSHERTLSGPSTQLSSLKRTPPRPIYTGVNTETQPSELVETRSNSLGCSNYCERESFKI